jgi:hypothetical protein
MRERGYDQFGSRSNDDIICTAKIDSENAQQTHFLPRRRYFISYLMIKAVTVWIKIAEVDRGKK